MLLSARWQQKRAKNKKRLEHCLLPLFSSSATVIKEVTQHEGALAPGVKRWQPRFRPSSIHGTSKISLLEIQKDGATCWQSDGAAPAPPPLRIVPSFKDIYVGAQAINPTAICSQVFECSDAFQCRWGQGASLQRQVGVTNPGYYRLIKALLNIPQSQFSVKYTNTPFSRCCSYYKLFISASSLTSVKYLTRTTKWTKMSYSVECDRNVTLYSQLKYEAYLPLHNQIFCLSDSVNIHACNGPQTGMITDFLECITSSFW